MRVQTVYTLTKDDAAFKRLAMDTAGLAGLIVRDDEDALVRSTGRIQNGSFVKEDFDEFIEALRLAALHYEEVSRTGVCPFPEGVRDGHPSIESDWRESQAQRARTIAFSRLELMEQFETALIAASLEGAK